MRNNGCIDSEQVVAVASTQDRAAWLQIYCAITSGYTQKIDPGNQVYFVEQTDMLFEAYKKRWANDSDS